MMKKISLLPTAACLFLAWALTVPAQGPLDPPGAPAPLMKTLNQIEPRTAITNVPFTIQQSGSYYLTGNLTGISGQSGITISTDNVTLDLMGFSLAGVPGSFRGITAIGPVRNLTIRNGLVAYWAQSGVDLNFSGDGVGALVEHVHAFSNGLHGIRVPAKGVVRDCLATHNMSNGIMAATYSRIENNYVAENRGLGIRVTSSGSTIQNNTVFLNYYYGIWAGSEGFIRNNHLTRNGSSSDGRGGGIYVSGPDNRIEGNTCTLNGQGILIDGSQATGNILLGNTCSGNATNWNVRIGNVGLVVNAAANAADIVGNSGGVSPGSTNPWANFTF